MIRPRPFAYGSVCSGIEAASVAWEPLGWRPSFFSEIASWPRSLLTQRHPQVPLRGDFTEIQAGEHDPIDLLVGGTPCQSFSLAGLRGGMGDARGNLALEYLRLADRLRPRWLLWENVPGVLSSNKGRDFGSFLAALGQLGYGFAYRVLDAQFFGLAQRRKRVFVVGYLGDWRRAAAVLFEPASLRRDPPPRSEAQKNPSGTLSASAGRRGGVNDPERGQLIPANATTLHARAASKGVDSDCTDTLLAFGGNNTSGPIDVATALNACHTAAGRQDFETETFITRTLRGEGFDASEDGTGRATPVVPVTATLSAGKGDEGNAAGLRREDDVKLVAGALCRNSFSGGAGGRPEGATSGHFVEVATAVRRLTPMECERLQGFPDNYTRIIAKVLKRAPPAKHFAAYPDLYEKTAEGWIRYAADGPRYQALGNSMAVPCMAWIGSRIAEQDRLAHGTRLMEAIA